jgi:hypothetical protein
MAHGALFVSLAFHFMKKDEQGLSPRNQKVRIIYGVPYVPRVKTPDGMFFIIVNGYRKEIRRRLLLILPPPHLHH